MKYTDVVIDAYASIGQALLVNVSPAYGYKNGVRTEEVTGYKYEVAMTEHGLDKISVKIEGKKLMDTPDNFVEVTFQDLEIYLYMMNGQLQVGARATGISVVKNK